MFWEINLYLKIISYPSAIRLPSVCYPFAIPSVLGFRLRRNPIIPFLSFSSYLRRFQAWQTRWRLWPTPATTSRGRRSAETTAGPPVPWESAGRCRPHPATEGDRRPRGAAARRVQREPVARAAVGELPGSCTAHPALQHLPHRQLRPRSHTNHWCGRNFGCAVRCSNFLLIWT